MSTLDALKRNICINDTVLTTNYGKVSLSQLGKVILIADNIIHLTGYGAGPLVLTRNASEVVVVDYQLEKNKQQYPENYL